MSNHSMKVSSPTASTACGDILIDDLEIKLTKLDSSVMNEEFLDIQSKISKTDEFENIKLTDKNNLDIKTNDKIKEFKLDNNSRDLSKRESFIDNLDLHLYEEDWCICDLVKENIDDKFISIPLDYSMNDYNEIRSPNQYRLINNQYNSNEIKVNNESIIQNDHLDDKRTIMCDRCYLSKKTESLSKITEINNKNKKKYDIFKKNLLEFKNKIFLHLIKVNLKDPCYYCVTIWCIGCCLSRLFFL